MIEIRITTGRGPNDTEAKAYIRLEMTVPKAFISELDQKLASMMNTEQMREQYGQPEEQEETNAEGLLQKDVEQDSGG